MEIPIADSSEIGFRGEVNVRRDACSKGSASIDGGDSWYAPRHLFHHAHHVAPTSCDLHTDAHPPTRDANATVERTVSHFHRKFTLMAFALHTSRALCETANRGQLQFISWCGRVRGFQTTRYTGLSWPISVIFCPRLHAS